MRQFYLIPLNRAARSIANNLRPIKHERKIPKPLEVCTGKLSKKDVDLVRCLLILGFNAPIISKMFGVKPATVHNIKMNYNHCKYTSVFQTNNYEVLSYNQEKLYAWCVENHSFILSKTVVLSDVENTLIAQKLNTIVKNTHY